MARKRTYLAWFGLGILSLVILAALSVLSSPVQTLVVRKALQTFNPSITGDLSLERIHVTLRGRLSLRGFRVRDGSGAVVLALDSLDAQTRFSSLRRDSIHVTDLQARGLSLHLIIDTTGVSNLQRALAPASPLNAKSPAKPTPWVVRLDQGIVTGKKTIIQLPRDLHYSFDSWRLSAGAVYGNDSLRYETRFAVPKQLEVTAAGEWLLGPSLKPRRGTIAVTADSSFTAILPEPADAVGQLALTTRYRLDADSLRVIGDLTSSRLGQVTLDAATPFPIETPAGRINVQFARLSLTPLLPDSAGMRLNGSANIVKNTDASLLNGWQIDLHLNDSRYADYALPSAVLQAETKDSVVTVSGQIETGHGIVKLHSRINGFDVATAQVRAKLETQSLYLHAIIPAIPDSLSPITASLMLNAQSVDPSSLSGNARLSVSPATLGHLSIDTISAFAHVQGKSFRVDSVYLRTLGILLSGSAEGELGSGIEFSAYAEIPSLADMQASMTGFLPQIDSIEGSVIAQVRGSASLTGDSLSQLRLTGFATGDSLKMSEYSLHRATLSLEQAEVDRPYASGLLRAQYLQAAGQQIDSVQLQFAGTPAEIAAQIALWAKADTIAVKADLTTKFEDREINIAVHEFTAAAYGIGWDLASPADFRLHENQLDMNGLELRSSVGVLRAAGTLKKDGEQDLVLELSGFQTEEIANVFKVPVPSSLINARLQLFGPDTALAGDLDIIADSVTMNGESLADYVELHANIDADRTELDGIFIWLGDTLTMFHGVIPARISSNSGLVLVDSLPIEGRVQLLAQPLSKLNRYMPFGTTLDGMISADVNFSGTPAQPRWAGAFSVIGGRYRDSRYGVDYKNMAISGSLSADTLRITNFNAESDGTLRGNGWAVMAFPLPSELHLDLTFDKFEAINGPMMRARASGQISVDGPLNRLDARGNIELQEVLYRITQATTKQVEEIDLKAELARMRGDSAEAPFMLSRFYSPMAHQLRIELPGNCWVKGGGVNLELAGDLRLYKDANARPTINGDVAVREGGGVSFLGREMRVQSGTVRYEGPIEDPTVDIIAYLPRPPMGVDSITAHVYGTLLNTRIELRGKSSSGEEMTPDSIAIALLGSGVRLFQSSEQGSIAGKMENVLTSAASSQLSNMVGQLAGLDVFEFRPGEGGLSDLSGGSLEVGTYVTDRLFVQVLQPIKTTQTGQKVSIEYRLFRWLKLRAQQSGRESSAFDLYLQFDWR